MGERSWNLGAFPKCLGKKPSHPPARAELRDFPEEEFPALLREVPLVWDVHQKIPNEIQCAPSDEIKLAVKCVHQIRGGPTTRDLLGQSRETKSPPRKMSAELGLFSVLFVA